MGLAFHIGQGGIDNLGEYLGRIEMDEHHWLQQNEFLIAGKTGHLPDDLEESIPYFDDVILTHQQVITIKVRFDLRKQEVMKTSEFKSIAVDKLEEILAKSLIEKKGLSTCAD